MARKSTKTSQQKDSKLKDHSQRAHALLSASGAGRWMNCTPSAKLEDEYGEKETSVYAQEGTLAHELAELYLRRDAVGEISEEQFDVALEEVMANSLFNEEMLDAVPVYTDYCLEQLAAARASNPYAVVKIEERLDLSEFIPKSFGTSDFTIISDGVLDVTDLKYGKGVPVYAEWNTQLMLYGLGALRKYEMMYDIEQVRLTIVQPRINNISSWMISAEELNEWAENVLRPKAERAFRGEGELQAGDWCKFCAVRNRCRKLYEQQIEIAKYEFAEAPLLSDEEIADVITRVPKLVDWANSILAYAQDKAVNDGKTWPGFKLVEGKSSRKWAVEENEVADTIMERFPTISEDEIFTKKLNSLTAIEKLVGKSKFAEELSDLTVKPQGKPTLVPQSDKRPALGYTQAQIDFGDEV